MEPKDWSGVWKGLFMAVITFTVFGVIILAVTGVFGSIGNEINNNLFNTSQEHTQAVAQRFSYDCLQLAQTSDPVAKKAIESDIYSMASTVDLKNIDMPDTTRACVNRAITDTLNNK